MQTYTSLKTSIANWMARDDLTSYLDDFIDIAESRVANRLRLSAQETDLSLTVAAGSVSASLPSDYLELRSLYRDGSPQTPMEYLTPEQLNNKSNDSRAPRLFTIQGTKVVLAGPTDAQYTLKGTYYAQFAALDGSNTSTWLTTNAPQVMLYACLRAAAEFIRDDAAAQKWNDLYEQAVKELEDRDQAGRYGPVPSMRSERVQW
jgi:hypothetical protein